MVRAGALAALVAALAGCDTSGGDDFAPVPLPDGVTVEFVQLRSDAAARQGQVRVHNDTDEAIRIGEVVVVDSGYPGGATRVNAGRTSTIAPDATVDIRVQLPQADCEATQGDTRVWLELFEAGGSVAALLPDPLDVLGPLHERECRAARVTDAVALSFSSFTASAPGEPARLTLTAVPTGKATATIGGIRTTNLLTFAGLGGSDAYPIGLEVDPSTPVDQIDIALPVFPLRCDPHAVQEDKRGTIFSLEVVVGGGAGEIELAASEDLRGDILTWVGQWCGFGG